jgi:uncharacterized peroxidase-related enzyme
MFDESPLHRYQREMLAVITSLYNSCKYCVEHHKQALLHYWKDEEWIDRLIKDYVNASISTKDKALCEMAHYLTKSLIMKARMYFSMNLENNN